MYLLLKPDYQFCRLSKTAILSILIIGSTWFQSINDYFVFASEEKTVELYKKKDLTKKKKKAALKKDQVHFYKISEKGDTFRLKKIKKRKIKALQDSEINEKKLKLTDLDNRQRNDNKIIEKIGSIIALMGKMESKTENKSEKIYKVPSRSVINGISIGKISYVILSNGDKIFKGGKLDNGCIVEDIKQKYILLNCNGYKKKKIL